MTHAPPPLRSADECARIEAAMQPLKTQAAACTACALSQSRTQVVFGAGSARARILVIGEAPGATEDATGLPFVGRSGKLLDQLLAGIGIARGDVFVANVLKCRPPANRAPRLEEARACAPFLAAQIELLAPRVILALGLCAARWLVPGKAPMSALRAARHSYLGTPTLITYHPAAILRNPHLRPDAEADFATLRALAETKVATQ